MKHQAKLHFECSHCFNETQESYSEIVLKAKDSYNIIFSEPNLMTINVQEHRILSELLYLVDTARRNCDTPSRVWMICRTRGAFDVK